MKVCSIIAGATLAPLISLALSGTASAAPITWTFDNASCVSTAGPSGNCGSGAGNFSDARTYQGTGLGAGDVTVSGWANTIDGNERLQQGQIMHSGGGLGVRNSDFNSGDAGEGASPELSIDNDDRFDLVLFDFGNVSVTLDAINLGGFTQDADISILAYTGNLDPTNSAAAHYIGDREAWWNSDTDKNEDLTTNGWTLIGNHDVDSGPGIGNDQAINSGNVASNYWLVSAYNPVFGSNCSPSNSYCQSDYEDYFNILSVTGEVQMTTIPEPGTLALLGLAGLGFACRRKVV